MKISQGAKEKIFKSVENLEERLVQTVSEMVQIKSINPGFGVEDKDNEGGETRVNEYTKKIMEGMGLETDFFSVAEDRFNLVGTYKSEGNGKSLLFNGHVDVVPPSGNDWIYDPFGGKIEDGYIHGRGSMDMKGGNAAALFALKALLDAGFKPQGDIVFQNAVGEELKHNDLGTSACIRRGHRADVAICCEASSSDSMPFQINPASSGILRLQWSVRGKACHAGLRREVIRAGGLGEEIGVDAFEKGMIVYNALKDLEIRWGQTKKHPLFKPGNFCINTAVMKGGTAASFVPDYLEMSCAVVYPPQESPEDIKKEIETQIYNAYQNDPWLKKNPPEITWVFNWPAYDVSVDEEICGVAQECVKEISPEGGEFVAMFAVADASFIFEEGIPVIILGPGNQKYAHVSNEKLDIKSLIDVTKMYALIIAEWCGIK